MLFRRFVSAMAIAALSLLPTQPAWSWPQEFLGMDVSSLPTDEIAAAWGLDPKHADSRWARNGVLGVQMIHCTAQAAVAWPGDTPAYTFQFTNLTDQAVQTTGLVRVIQYELFTKGEDVFTLGMRRLADCGTTPITLNVAAKGTADVTVTPTLPERLGGYAVIIELDGQSALFGAGTIRTFKPEQQARQFRRLTMDLYEPQVLERLGATVNRYYIFAGVSPKDQNYAAWYKGLAANMQELRKANLPVCIEFGAEYQGGPTQPLGFARPWLNDKDELLGGKTDSAWLPSRDPEFKALVKRVATDFGWPKGPINAMKLWNEPWNGISISGWGADDERYREIFGALCEGVEEAEKEGGVEVLTGGCDSSSNTWDKLFADGTDTWLPRLDFLSIHYQGISSSSTVKKWRDRKGPDGKPSPVRIWDTESWVANSDDRVAGVLAMMFASGQDRVVGIQADNVVAAVRNLTVKTATGEEKRRVYHTWSVGAAVGAFQHFVGERPFQELLFRPGLPTAMLFKGEQAEDATVVVVGDAGPLFGLNLVGLRTCRSLAELREKEAWRSELKAMPIDSPARAALLAKLAKTQPFRDCTMTLAAAGNYGLFDFYANAVPAVAGQIVVPLDARGFFLRGDGSAGSAAALIAAVRAGRIEGLAPITLQVADAVQPLGKGAAFTLILQNVLNRPVEAALSVTIAGLTVSVPSRVALKPGERVEIPLHVTAGTVRPDNRYPARIVADFGADGVVAHEEELRANVIARRSIAVDGKLEDWGDALPQTVEFSGAQTATLTEKAWLPFLPADESVKKGLATSWLAYDDANLYFAARINDTTPHPGAPRFADNRHWDDYFYPAVSYSAAAPRLLDASLRWTGQVIAPVSGTYAFATLADDGVRLWVDGKPLVEAWKGQGPTWYEGTLNLEAGKRYELKLEYFQGGGAARIQLAWTPPGKTRDVIPTTVLFADGAATTPTGLACEVFRGTDLKNRFLKKLDPLVDFTWSEGPLSEASFSGGTREAHPWPAGVRRYSYRTNPVLPCGNFPNFDNVQLAFNVLPDAQKKEDPTAPGTYPGFIVTGSSDYEYALNTVAERWGGGTEVWRLRHPAMPVKHFYPRQPASPADGAVAGAQLMTSHVGATRLLECAIPWAELPEVQAAMRAGQPVKLSFRVNDDAGVGCMELARGRSISRVGGAFFAEWLEHWENQVSFGWER